MSTSQALRVAQYPQDHSRSDVADAIRTLHHARPTRQHKDAVARLRASRDVYTFTERGVGQLQARYVIGEA